MNVYQRLAALVLVPRQPNFDEWESIMDDLDRVSVYAVHDTTIAAMSERGRFFVDHDGCSADRVLLDYYPDNKQERIQFSISRKLVTLSLSSIMTQTSRLVSYMTILQGHRPLQAITLGKEQLCQPTAN